MLKSFVFRFFCLDENKNIEESSRENIILEEKILQLLGNDTKKET